MPWALLWCIFMSSERNKEMTYIEEDAIVRQELDAVVAECSVDNWNGYGAKPINHESVQKTIELLSLIPANLPRPEFSCDPDGCVALDWFYSPYNVLSVSVETNGCLCFATLLGGKPERDGGRSRNGVLVFDGTFPSELKFIICEIFHIGM